ncbi:MAG: sigma-70 family RNA polymerase sigma factor [Oscillospiraceae bacterium]
MYIDEYKNLVYTICFSFVKNTFDAEDLAQETFISAYQHLSSFDDRNPKSWLAQIAANKCRDFLKSPARRITAVDSDDLEYICDEREGVEAEVERRAEMDEFAALCNRLKEPYRAVAVAYYCLDKTISEIGEETEANTKTVATRLYRAKKLLRTIMREDSSWSCLLTNT